MTLHPTTLRWLRVFALLTLFNLTFDWFCGRLGPLSAAWQSGMMSGLLWAWLIIRRPL